MAQLFQLEEFMRIPVILFLIWFGVLCVNTFVGKRITEVLEMVALGVNFVWDTYLVYDSIVQKQPTENSIIIAAFAVIALSSLWTKLKYMAPKKHYK